jgi:hypothetical protein
MTLINKIARVTVDLFAEDGWLALAVLAVVALTAAAAALAPETPLLAGALLVFGYVAALARSVLKPDARTMRVMK